VLLHAVLLHSLLLAHMWWQVLTCTCLCLLLLAAASLAAGRLCAIRPYTICPALGCSSRHCW
jgi:hypothetical protein